MDLLNRLFGKKSELPVHASYNVRSDQFVIVRDALAGDRPFKRIATTSQNTYISVNSENVAHVAIVTKQPSVLGEYLLVEAIYEVKPSEVEHCVQQLIELE